MNKNPAYRFGILEDIKHQQFNIFSEPVDFWKLSQLSCIYTDIFDKPMDVNFIKSMDKSIQQDLQLKNITSKPIHILTTQDIYDPTLPDQYISRVACKYIFDKQELEFEQAYFLYPNKTFKELEIIAQDIQIQNIRSKISNQVGKIAVMINRAEKTYPNAHSDIWSVMWANLFNMSNYDTVRAECNIKDGTSPFDYMSAQMLHYIYPQLQNTINRLSTYKYLTINCIKTSLIDMAKNIYMTLRRDELYPKDELLENSTTNKLRKLKRNYNKFLQKYYFKSL